MTAQLNSFKFDIPIFSNYVTLAQIPRNSQRQTKTYRIYTAEEAADLTRLLGFNDSPEQAAYRVWQWGKRREWFENFTGNYNALNRLFREEPTGGGQNPPNR